MSLQGVFWVLPYILKRTGIYMHKTDYRYEDSDPRSYLYKKADVYAENCDDWKSKLRKNNPV